jgi:hypothetical protein
MTSPNTHKNIDDQGEDEDEDFLEQEEGTGHAPTHTKQH